MFSITLIDVPSYDAVSGAAVLEWTAARLLFMINKEVILGGRGSAGKLVPLRGKQDPPFAGVVGVPFLNSLFCEEDAKLHKSCQFAWRCTK